MRIVLDTVVIIRALLDPESWSGRILFRHANDYEFIVSAAINAEYLDVTSRPGISSKLARRNRNVSGLLDLLARATEVAPDVVPAICRDPGDDKFLAAALAAGANYLVSEDRDLLDMGEYEGIPIVSTQTMIDLLTARDAQP
ncbi:MAG: putative toxin-antitoxin system toxin component, PIN family [Thermomicrobiales bacterium]